MKKNKYQILNWIIIFEAALLFSISINSCSVNNSGNRYDFSLFWDSPDLEALEPFKFDFYDSLGEPMTFQPEYVKYDTIRDNLIVLDYIKSKILIISSQGDLIAEIGREGDAVSELSRPGHIGYDRYGNIYIIDQNKIEIYDSLGNEWHSFYPEYRPWQILVEDTNSIYVLTTRPSNGKILAKYNLSGELLGEYVDKVDVNISDRRERRWLERVANQSYITQDGDKNIYVAFSGEYRIVKIDEQGNVDPDYIIRELPFEPIKPHFPEDTTDQIASLIIGDISVDEKGNLYVLWGETFGQPFCRVDVYDHQGEMIDVLKLAVPYPGEQRRTWYISPLGDIEVFGGYLYAVEILGEGLIYRYGI
ncbi:MAG: hypothetical protein APR63_09275 [Desulfuromonas sp. SDB]|nr:MAG: hypothetical protein APR63_09275 [Desulfuromonas sp. SDB]